MKTKYVVISSVLLMLLSLIGPVDAYGQKKKIKDLPTVSDPGGNCDNNTYKLVFQDEFEGNELDRTKWITHFPFSDDGSENCESCRYLGSNNSVFMDCLLYTSDAADERSSVDVGGRRIITKKKKKEGGGRSGRATGEGGVGWR